MPYITSTKTTRRRLPTRTRRNTRVPKAQARVSKPMTSAVRAIAKSVVRKETEDKYVSFEHVSLHNSSISAATECYPLFPAVPQGVDDYQRIGDRIRGKYLYVKGFIQYSDDYLNTPNVQQYLPPSTVRVLVLSQKDIKTATDVQTNADVSHLLKDNVGTGTARPYTGATWDNLAPINKDLFKVHMDRKIKMNWVQHYVSNPAGGNLGTSVASGNDRTKYFYCRIKAPATLTFDTRNGDFANNFSPFICIGATCDDGQNPWSLNNPYRLVVQSTLYFEDA